MIGLPESTVVNRRIHKQRFYDNLSVTANIKRIFVEQIGFIYWRNKIAPSTVNIADGDTVHEIQIIEIRLHQPNLDERVLKLIDKKIPYHILFILSYNDKFQAWMSYKEQNQTKVDTFKVGTYFHTYWVEDSVLGLALEGLNMDTVYEGFLHQIAPELFAKHGREGNIKEVIENRERKKRLQAQITTLEKKIIREKQFNKQVELNAELRLMKAEFEVSK